MPKYEFIRPNKDNVHVGDLVLINGEHSYYLVPITKVEEDYVFAQGSIITHRVPHNRAVIIKHSEICLIGQQVTGLLEHLTP